MKQPWLVACTLLACNASNSTGDGKCASNADCAPGEACLNEDCQTICRSDLDCADGTLCENDVCVTGIRDTVPVIASINGDGSADPDVNHTDNRVHHRLTILGENFDGAGVTLASATETWELPLCEAETTRLVVEMPEELTPDSYLLTVASQAGACSATLPVLQGEKGDNGNTGPQGAPGVPCVGCVDSATIAGGAVLATHLGTSVYGGTGAAATIARSDHGHDDASAGASGFMSAADKDKLDSFGEPGGLNCVEEFDLIERGTNIVSFWPNQAKRAELMQYGWICWNRTDDDVKISPLTDNVLLNTYWNSWVNPNYKVCAPINWSSAPEDTNRSFLSIKAGSYYFGLRALDGATNTWHGRWAWNAGESSGSVGAGDRWTIWTCR